MTRARRASMAAAVAAAVGVGLAGGGVARAAPACSPNTTVHTRSGPVCGVTAKGQRSYLDIRYAAPPVGKLRWQPPQPVHPWTTTYRATTRGAGCITLVPGGHTVEHGTSEDCLFLEVQEPAHASPHGHLPVIVEFHGGGFVGEYRDDDGTNLTHSGPAIYVYMGYRIGIFGFLAHAALGAHSGDYGLMDQQAALRWVKANISRFGGNPGNVTVFGESAGGASVCDAVASPTAKGLFQRGISISGFYNFDVNTIWSPADCKSRLPTERQAQRSGAAFARAVGCTGGDVAACLRRVSVPTLAQRAGRVEQPFRGGNIGPIANGTTLPQSAAQIFAEGRENHVGLIIGVGADEFNGGVYDNSPGHTVVADTVGQYRSLVRRQFGTAAGRVMALYPPDRYPAPGPFIAYREIMADQASVCPALETESQLGRHIPTYAYLDQNSDPPLDESKTEPLGANHSSVNRLAHDVPSSLTPDQRALQTEVLGQWEGFARNGDPSPTGTPSWQPFTAAGSPVMELASSGNSTDASAASVRAEHHCGFWDRLNRSAPWAVG